MIMNRNEHFLDILGEECVEVAKEVSKSLRFSLNEVMDGQPLSNRERIMKELQDLYAVVILCYEEGILNELPLVTLPILDAKRHKIEKYLLRSEEYGALI